METIPRPAGVQIRQSRPSTTAASGKFFLRRIVSITIICQLLLRADQSCWLQPGRLNSSLHTAWQRDELRDSYGQSVLRATGECPHSTHPCIPVGKSLRDCLCFQPPNTTRSGTQPVRPPVSKIEAGSTVHYQMPTTPQVLPENGGVCPKNDGFYTKIDRCPRPPAVDRDGQAGPADASLRTK